jgi:acyl carrier protein
MSKIIESKIRYLAESAFGSGAFNDQEDLARVPGWDSLRFAEFIIALQKEFKIKLSPSDIAALVNLSAAYAIITKKL